MRKVAIVFGILAGAALAFVLCGGVSMARAAFDAMNAPARVVSVDTLQ